MLWSHNCNSEHNDDIKTCPECGGELSEEMPPTPIEPAKASWRFTFRKSKDSPEWPIDSSGNKVKPAFLANISGTQLDYEMALSLLRAYNIPYTCDFPGAGPLVRILVGFSGAGMDIYVPETMLDDAREILFVGAEDEN
jgi:hypothetical protein